MCEHGLTIHRQVSCRKMNTSKWYYDELAGGELHGNFIQILPKFARTDQYVRIIGLVKTFQNRRTVNAGHIRAITDYNEIFYHKLDAIYTHLQVTRPTGVSSDTNVEEGNNFF